MNDLREMLRQMDADQQRTDEGGEREIAWYHYRDDIEDIMGLTRGSLDSSQEVPHEESRS